jgi:hypothetical protein
MGRGPRYPKIPAEVTTPTVWAAVPWRKKGSSDKLPAFNSWSKWTMIVALKTVPRLRGRANIPVVICVSWFILSDYALVPEHTSRVCAVQFKLINVWHLVFRRFNFTCFRMFVIQLTCDFNNYLNLQYAGIIVIINNNLNIILIKQTRHGEMNRHTQYWLSLIW